MSRAWVTVTVTLGTFCNHSQVEPDMAGHDPLSNYDKSFQKSFHQEEGMPPSVFLGCVSTVMPRVGGVLAFTGLALTCRIQTHALCTFMLTE